MAKQAIQINSTFNIKYNSSNTSVGQLGNMYRFQHNEHAVESIIQ